MVVLAYMKTVLKPTWAIPAALVLALTVVLVVQSSSRTSPVAQPDVAQPQLYRADVQTRTQPATSSAQFVVTVVDEVVLELNGLTREEAVAACEEVAYDATHMWKQVVCVYEGVAIYDDIFIAG